MKKRGQFFLIAAVVIITIIVSVATVTNYTQKKDTIKLYDLGKELGIESQQVLDYGTYNNLDSEEMIELLEGFIENYVGYIDEEKNIYFVFGNKQQINVMGYQEIIEEEVEVCFDLDEETKSVITRVESGDCVPYISIGERQSFTKVGDEEINDVIISIEDIQYEFSLDPGENFYFVIWQNIGGQKEVVTSETE